MRAFLLVFIALCGVSLQAQYFPLLQEDKIWQINIRYAEEGFHTESYKIIAYLKGDTLVDTAVYKKLYYQTFDKYIVGPPEVIIDSSLQSPNLYALLREDTISKQVFIYQDSEQKENVEYLLYDFSLQQGDSIQTYLIGRGPKPMGGGAMEVSYAFVDTIIAETCLDGSIRNKLIFKHGAGPNSPIIEGIGGSEFIGALINPVYVPLVSGSDYKEELICVRQNGQLIYGDCESVNSIRENHEDQHAFIFPNPSLGVITVNRLTTGEQIFILNALSQVVHKTKATGDYQRFDMTTNPDGMYFVQTDRGIIGKFLLTGRE